MRNPRGGTQEGSHMKTVLGVLQARMSSTRLPGKVLERVEDAPMIVRQIERLRRSSLIDELVVATSQDATDDELAIVLGEYDIEVYRGELSDVLARYLGAIQRRDPHAVVRLTADCPLTSALVVDQVISKFLENDADYASNTLTPTFPDGLDVEVVRPEALRWLGENSQDRNEREHVTLGIYRRPELFKLLNVRDHRDNSRLRWTVDDAEDLEFVRWVYSMLYPTKPEFEYQDVLDLIEGIPERSRTSAHAKRNAALEGLNVGAMSYLPAEGSNCDSA